MSNGEAPDVAAAWWAERLRVGDRARFRESLATSIRDLFQSGAPPVNLVCDYEPWDILMDAVRAAGVTDDEIYTPDGVLPRKHRMMVWPTVIEVREGYGAATRVLWEADVVPDEDARAAASAAAQWWAARLRRGDASTFTRVLSAALARQLAHGLSVGLAWDASAGNPLVDAAVAAGADGPAPPFPDWLWMQAEKREVVVKAARDRPVFEVIFPGKPK